MKLKRLHRYHETPSSGSHRKHPEAFRVVFMFGIRNEPIKWNIVICFISKDRMFVRVCSVYFRRKLNQLLIWNLSKYRETIIIIKRLQDGSLSRPKLDAAENSAIYLKKKQMKNRRPSRCILFGSFKRHFTRALS